MRWPGGPVAWTLNGPGGLVSGPAESGLAVFAPES
jgi:hypothetical protein